MSKIFNFTEAFSIGLHGLVLIAKDKNKMINVQKISDATGSSRHHVAKILQRLVKAGYLRSSRGPSGGFELIKDPDKIRLSDIYELIEGKLEVPNCPFDHELCPFNSCLMGDITQKLSSEFITYLKNTRISSLLDH